MNDSLQLFDKQLSIVTKPIPKISSPTDVLIKVAYSGVCGTDLHILSGEFPASQKAVTLGHEFCGVVCSHGDKVKHVKVGDRVAINPNNNCHVCQYCVEGSIHFCDTGGIRSTVGIWRNGGWANFCRVPGELVHKIDDNLPFKLAVLIEPFSCIARGWENIGELKTDAKILVCGAGIIGLLWSSLLHFKGYRDITVSEISDRRRNMVIRLNLGFKATQPSKLATEFREATLDKKEFGFDLIIDCTGAPKAIEESFNWLRRGATFLIFGCCPKDSEIKINPFDVYNKELIIKGSLINPFTFTKAVSLVKDMSEYLNYDKLGIKLFQLHDYATSLKALKEGVISKAVFHLEESDD